MNTPIKTNIILKLPLQKIAYSSNRRINMAEIEFGFRYINGNTDSYFTCTGSIWNGHHTDCVTCGCGVQKEILKYLPYNNLLIDLCILADKIHLKNWADISMEDRKTALSIMRRAADMIALKNH